MALSGQFVFTMAVAAVAVQSVVGFDSRSYGPNFRGDGTFYGPTNRGHCAFRERLPRTFANMVPISLSYPQYDKSASCGACIEFYGTGRGSAGTKIGTHKQYGYVHDSCHDCGNGDLDLALHGDGRHEVVWKFIPCPVDDVQLLFEGSNMYYKKVQIRGTKFPIVSAVVDNKPSLMSDDNFFVSHGQFPNSATIVAKDVSGNEYRIQAAINVADGLVIPNSVQKNGNSMQNGNSGSPGHRKPSSKCVARGKPCTYSRKCCRGSVCARVRWASSRRCIKKPAPKCIPRYKFCTGPRRPHGSKSCCGRLRCKHSRGLKYMRCLPR